MKKILFLVIILCLVKMTALAQVDDNISFLKIQRQINDGDYFRALQTLNTISITGKSSPFFLTYSATCYEKTYQFDKSIEFYQALYKRTNSFDAMKKIAELEDYQENKIRAIKIDSIFRGTLTNVGLFKFTEDKDVKNEKLIVIGRKGSDFGLAVFSLPSFEFKTIVHFSDKVETNNGSEVYSFNGKYNISFSNEYSACASLVPKSVTMIGNINIYLNKIFLVLWTYQCNKKSDGTFEAIKDSDSDPSGFKFSKVADFSF